MRRDEESCSQGPWVGAPAPFWKCENADCVLQGKLVEFPATTAQPPPCRCGGKRVRASAWEVKKAEGAKKPKSQGAQLFDATEKEDAALVEWKVVKATQFIDKYFTRQSKTPPSALAAGSPEYEVVTPPHDINQILSPGIATLYKDTTDATDARLEYFLELAGAVRKFSGKKPARGSLIEMNDFLGKDNVALYKKAIAEEDRSRAFREAVTLAGLKTFGSMKWNLRQQLIVGGASGSGKSFGAKVIIQALMQAGEDFPEVFQRLLIKPEVTTGPITRFVGVDGGDARAVSQVRKMTLQCALALGYKGIDDLDKVTKFTVKDVIKQAARWTPNLHVIEPRTFAELGETFQSIAYAVSQTVFCMVKTAKEVVARQGDVRAWWSGQPPRPSSIDLNHPDVGCESKAYHDHYKWGDYWSRSALAAYLAASPNPIVVWYEANSKLGNGPEGIDRSQKPDVYIYCGRVASRGLISDTKSFKRVQYLGFDIGKRSEGTLVPEKDVRPPLEEHP